MCSCEPKIVTQNSYFELQIKINPEFADIMSEFCFENFDCEGVVLAEESYKDLELTDTTEGTLRVFLRSADSVDEILKSQRELFLERGLTEAELGTWEYSLIEAENQDWSKSWKEKWDITRVSDKIVIVPSWLEYNPKADEIVITLDPGCAFGTGTHPTTQLCMRAMEKHMQKGWKMADIGMGSGILAICAKKIGSDYVYGCDNDETVIETAIKNADENAVECQFELNTIDKVDMKFDFICANILHNVLAEIMGELARILLLHGRMVLSGILDEKKQVVLDAIEKHNLELIEEMQQDQWVGLVVRRKQ